MKKKREKNQIIEAQLFLDESNGFARDERLKADFFAESEQALYDRLRRLCPDAEPQLSPEARVVIEDKAKTQRQKQAWFDGFVAKHFPKEVYKETGCVQPEEYDEAAARLKEMYLSLANGDFFPDDRPPGAQKLKKPPSRTAAKRRKPVWAGLGLTAAALALVFCLVYVLPLLFGAPADFNIDNRYHAVSDLSSLNSSQEHLEFSFKDYFYLEVIRGYDRRHRQDLYYIVSFEGADGLDGYLSGDGGLGNAINSHMIIYIHPRYTPRTRGFEYFPNVRYAEINGMTMEYISMLWVAWGDMYRVTTLARIRHNGITVYITHEEVSYDRSDNFFDFAAQSIQAVR